MEDVSDTMYLYFVNGSKQRKELVESDYVEDIIDVMIDFFETHNRFPHVMQAVRKDEFVMIIMANTSEHFLVTDVSEEDEEELKNGLRI